MIVRELKSLRFKPLPRHPVVVAEVSFHSHLAAAHTSIMLLKLVKEGASAQQEQQICIFSCNYFPGFEFVNLYSEFRLTNQRNAMILLKLSFIGNL